MNRSVQFDQLIATGLYKEWRAGWQQRWNSDYTRYVRSRWICFRWTGRQTGRFYNPFGFCTSYDNYDNNGCFSERFSIQPVYNRVSGESWKFFIPIFFFLSFLHRRKTVKNYQIFFIWSSYRFCVSFKWRTILEFKWDFS